MPWTFFNGTIKFYRTLRLPAAERDNKQATPQFYRNRPAFDRIILVYLGLCVADSHGFDLHLREKPAPFNSTS